MSTRSCIGVLTGGDPEQGTIKFDGRYHHSDGYPTGLGIALLDHLRDHFKGNVQALVNYFVYSDEAKCGWSSVLSADLSHVPISPEDRMKVVLEQGIEAAFNTHGERAPINYASRGYEPEYMMDALSDSGQEWGYIFDIERNSLYVLKWLWEDQREPLAETGWYLLGRLDLGSKERTPETDSLIMSAYEALYYNDERSEFRNLPCLKAVDRLALEIKHRLAWLRDWREAYLGSFARKPFSQETFNLGNKLGTAKADLLEFLQNHSKEVAELYPNSPILARLAVLKQRWEDNREAHRKSLNGPVDEEKLAYNRVTRARHACRKYVNDHEQAIIDAITLNPPA